MTRHRRAGVATLVSALALTLGAQVPTVQALPAVDCAALSAPVYQASRPGNAGTLLTFSESEAKKAADFGFTIYSGAAFKASRSAESDLVPVHRLYRDGDFAFISDREQIAELVAQGYVDQSVAFYAATEQTWCTQPVYSTLSTGGRHQYRTSSADSTERPSFYVAAPAKKYGNPTAVEVAMPDINPKDTEFSFAVIPDTQQEVHRGDDPRLKHRSEWLVANRLRLDLRWAIQVGDLVDWDTPDHAQYEWARTGMQPVIDDKIPLFLNIGNHDSQATTVGGGARDPRFTRSLARMTYVMNDYFSINDYSAPVGSFEPGKIDNTYTRIRAGGRYWLLLNLELWPRPEVIKWAARLVSYHKHHNVIISTHSFVSSSGSLSTSAGYGSTSPRYLWDNLVKKYRNIKFVLCGHTGTAKTFIKRGTNGNKIYALLTTYHSNLTNPVRLIRISTRKNTITTWVEGPWTNTRLMSPVTFTGVGLVA